MDKDVLELRDQLNRIETAIINQKDVLTFDEAVQFTGMRKSYMYKLTSDHKIPHYKPSGKMVYFNRNELQTWLLQNRVSTQDELESKAQAYCIK
uniref:helix-turn-helix domain-containing protein n=1 Tax=uncultured Dysgonomonas sp. TaxID=206096 RepID=UPI00263972C9|nr:helix-turn-helix domain-containing protein [uncultured Dysgonomonas sp.]